MAKVGMMRKGRRKVRDRCSSGRRGFGGEVDCDFVEPDFFVERAEVAAVGGGGKYGTCLLLDDGMMS